MSRARGWGLAAVVSLGLWALIIWGMSSLAGCEQLMQLAQDANDPNNAPKVAAAEATAEGAVGILQGLAAVWPGAAVGAVSLATALRAWRNAKKQLATSESTGAQYYHVTESLVGAINDYRSKNPEKWESLKVALESAVGPEAENVIRAIRGLPVKT